MNWLLFFELFTLSTFDTLITLVCMKKFEKHFPKENPLDHEENRIAVFFMKKFGITKGLIMMDLFFITPILLVVVFLFSRCTINLLIGGYISIIVSNARLLYGLHKKVKRRWQG